MTSAARWKSPTFVFSLKNRWFGWIFPAKLWDFIFSHRDFTNEKHGNVSVSKGGIAWLTPLFQWWPFEVWGNEALNRPLNSWQLTRVSQLGWKQNWLDLIQTWSHGGLLQSISLDQEVTIIYSEWWFLFLFFAPPVGYIQKFLLHLSNFFDPSPARTFGKCRPSPDSSICDGQTWAMREVDQEIAGIYSRLIQAERNSVLVNPINRRFFFVAVACSPNGKIWWDEAGWRENLQWSFRTRLGSKLGYQWSHQIGP